MIAVTSTIAIGTVFNVVLPLSPTLAILIAGGIVVAYSVAGGMWSITLTDFLQFCIMTVGIFFLLLPRIVRAGGLSGMQEALPASYFDLTAIGWQTIFTYFLLFFFGLMIVVGALFWRRATAAGALASMAAGSAAVVIFMVRDGLFANTPIIWGLVASLVADRGGELADVRTLPGRAWRPGNGDIPGGNT